MVLNGLKINRKRAINQEYILVVCCECKQIYAKKSSHGAGYMISHGYCGDDCTNKFMQELRRYEQKTERPAKSND